MNVRFDVYGPGNKETGQDWNVNMSMGSPKNVFIRQELYVFSESAVRMVKQATKCFKETVIVTAVIRDSRDPLNLRVYSDEELRK